MTHVPVFATDAHRVASKYHADERARSVAGLVAQTERDEIAAAEAQVVRLKMRADIAAWFEGDAEIAIRAAASNGKMECVVPIGRAEYEGYSIPIALICLTASEQAIAEFGFQYMQTLGYAVQIGMRDTNGKSHVVFHIDWSRPK